MFVLMWWLIPIGAAAVATWWVYAIAPSDARDPNKPKSKRELERMRQALSKPLPAPPQPAERPGATTQIDLTAQPPVVRTVQAPTPAADQVNDVRRG